MKKFLRFLVILVAVVAAAVLILALVEPGDVVVTRTIVIKAPKDAVFNQMVMFKNWPNWSPWYQMEPTMKIMYGGTDGQPGSNYHWEGTAKTGEGDMKNTAVNGTQMDFDVTFTKPDRGTAHGILKAEDTAGMTRATWSFSMHMPFPMNAMLVFMNMDKMLGGDFENGLSNMKKYLESQPAASSDTEIKEVDFPAHIYEGVRQTVSMNDIMKFCGETFDMIKKDAGSKIVGAATGIYYTWDTTKKSTDMVAAFPVSDSATPVKGASFINSGPMKGYMAVLKGGYSKEMATHKALSDYVTAKGQKMAFVLEEYPAGPKNEPDSNKWVTNIYYLVQ